MNEDEKIKLREKIITIVFSTQADANMGLIVSNNIYKWVLKGFNKNIKEE